VFCYFIPASHNASYSLSLHDALPIYNARHGFTSTCISGRSTPEKMPQRKSPLPSLRLWTSRAFRFVAAIATISASPTRHFRATRSEEHTSELQSRENLVCRLLLEKKK